MTQKEIQFKGRTIPLTFNMATQIAFEQISQKAFDLALMTHAENRLALYYSAIISADKNTSVTFDELMEADYNDIKAIDKAVEELIAEFYHIGKIAEAHVPVDNTPAEEKAKN